MTFRRFGELAREIPEIVRLTDVVYAYQEKTDLVEPWYKDLVFDVSGKGTTRLSPSPSAPCSSQGEWGQRQAGAELWPVPWSTFKSMDPWLTAVPPSVRRRGPQGVELCVRVQKLLPQPPGLPLPPRLVSPRRRSAHPPRPSILARRGVRVPRPRPCQSRHQRHGLGLTHPHRRDRRESLPGPRPDCPREGPHRQGLLLDQDRFEDSGDGTADVHHPSSGTRGACDPGRHV